MHLQWKNIPLKKFRLLKVGHSSVVWFLLLVSKMFRNIYFLPTALKGNHIFLNEGFLISWWNHYKFHARVCKFYLAHSAICHSWHIDNSIDIGAGTHKSNRKQCFLDVQATLSSYRKLWRTVGLDSFKPSWFDTWDHIFSLPSCRREVCVKKIVCESVCHWEVCTQG